MTVGRSMDTYSICSRHEVPLRVCFIFGPSVFLELHFHFERNKKEKSFYFFLSSAPQLIHVKNYTKAQYQIHLVRFRVTDRSRKSQITFPYFTVIQHCFCMLYFCSYFQYLYSYLSVLF